MEESKKEVKDYLTSVVNPVLKPMVEGIASARPDDIMTFILSYAEQEVGTQLFRQHLGKKGLVLSKMMAPVSQSRRCP